ncbi:MAG: pyridoxal phosphate-dependent aminotransferase, partial [Acidilobaceae archaeon]
MLRAHGGRPPEGVLDFSSPINPLGPPKALVESIERMVRERVYVKYPDYSYGKLKEAIAGYYNLNVENVMPLSGAAEGLSLLILALKPRYLITVEPAFGDHKIASRALGIPWVTVPYALEGLEYRLDPGMLCGLPGELRRDSLVILSNPNNPSGSLTPKNVMEELLSCLDKSSILVVDEAFSDFTGDSESFLWSSLGDVVVLRSFTKILAMPGLRAGFMYTLNTRINALIDSVRQPWNVNIIVSEALRELLEEGNYLKQFTGETLRLIESERSFLASNMRVLGFQVYNSKAPFLLVKHSEPHPEFNSRLAARGVYVRDASSFAYLSPYHSRVSVRL